MGACTDHRHRLQPRRNIARQQVSIQPVRREHGKMDTRNNRDFGGAIIQFVGAG